MGIPGEQIKIEASFVKDFEFVEFQVGYLIFYVEIYFRITISESDYFELDTIGSTMDFVKRKLKRRDNLKISRREIRPVEVLKSIPRNIFKSTKVWNLTNYSNNRYLFLSKCAV